MLSVGVPECQTVRCFVVVAFTKVRVISKCSTPFRAVVRLTLIFHLLVGAFEVYFNLQMEWKDGKQKIHLIQATSRLAAG